MFKECEGCETNQQKPGNVQVKAVTLCPSLKLLWVIFSKQRGWDQHVTLGFEFPVVNWYVPVPY